MPTTEHMNLTPLVGHWRLLSCVMTMSDTREQIEIFGPHPEGHMILDPGGRIMFLFARPDRAPPTSDTDRATLFTTMMAYTGRARLAAPDRLVTTIDLAWNPAFEGEQTRFITLEPNRLTLQTPEQLFPRYGNRPATGNAVFLREPA